MEENKVPTIREAMSEIENELPPELSQQPSIKEPPPPPPQDWVSHPITKAIGIIVLLVAIVSAIVFASSIRSFIMVHRLGSGLIGFAVLMFIVIVLVAYWRARELGEVGKPRTFLKSPRKNEVSRKP